MQDAGAGRALTPPRQRPRAALQRLLAAWVSELHALRGAHKGLARWAIDVDPLAI